MITTRDKNIFISFLNEGGYVLDFNSYNFDAFTLESVGVAVLTEYGLSKGKSLDAYIRDPKTSDEKVEKHRQWAAAPQAVLAPCNLSRGRCGLRSYALNRGA